MGEKPRMSKHQYIDRQTEEVRTEKLIGDRLVNFLYSRERERPLFFYNALTSARLTRLLGFINYDWALATRISGYTNFVSNLGIDLSECVDPPEKLNTPRRIFERRIRYWELRPMQNDSAAVVSPADARMLPGSFRETSQLFIKEKFFCYEDLLGAGKGEWLAAFRGGDFAIFRLTPDKYHYNHAPVSGTVVDFYELPGGYHSCNPGAVVAVETPYSKNKRVITIIDTDVPGGTNVGLVAMIEIVALMIGEIKQCYSARHYDAPVAVQKGMFLKKGQPKSLYRPGSSTDVLIFQPDRVRFAGDLLRNAQRLDVVSRFTTGFYKTMVETDVQVRSTIGRAA